MDKYKVISNLRFIVSAIFALSMMYLFIVTSSSDNEIISSAQLTIRGITAISIMILTAITNYFLGKLRDKL